MSRGVDLSHWNDVVNLKKTRAAGYEFAFHKCTEGTTYKDPTYLDRKKAIRDAGLLFGCYHFGKGGDPIKEADFFLSQIGELRAGEIVVLDFELPSMESPASWCRLWLDRVKEKLGFKPFLYTYSSILDNNDWTKVSSYGFPLWAARYGLQQQEPNPKYYPKTGSWNKALIWQYCSKGIVPGIVGNVDLNTCDEVIDDLKKYGKPRETTCSHCCEIHCPQ